mmetsp:Transcript_41369/g.110275  ORF Transcript_41369/g.110275 Transcript_41369/m.110275 type:complete len:448 (-) Transcript_41369:651-1994(-)
MGAPRPPLCGPARGRGLDYARAERADLILLRGRRVGRGRGGSPEPAVGPRHRDGGADRAAGHCHRRVDPSARDVRRRLGVVRAVAGRRGDHLRGPHFRRAQGNAGRCRRVCRIWRLDHYTRLVHRPGFVVDLRARVPGIARAGARVRLLGGGLARGTLGAVPRREEAELHRQLGGGDEVVAVDVEFRLSVVLLGLTVARRDEPDLLCGVDGWGRGGRQVPRRLGPCRGQPQNHGADSVPLQVQQPVGHRRCVLHALDRRGVSRHLPSAALGLGSGGRVQILRARRAALRTTHEWKTWCMLRVGGPLPIPLAAGHLGEGLAGPVHRSLALLGRRQFHVGFCAARPGRDLPAGLCDLGAEVQAALHAAGQPRAGGRLRGRLPDVGLRAVLLQGRQPRSHYRPDGHPHGPRRGAPLRARRGLRAGGLLRAALLEAGHAGGAGHHDPEVGP